jgi:hypothetical protein
MGAVARGTPFSSTTVTWCSVVSAVVDTAAVVDADAVVGAATAAVGASAAAMTAMPARNPEVARPVTSTLLAAALRASEPPAARRSASWARRASRSGVGAEGGVIGVIRSTTTRPCAARGLADRLQPVSAPAVGF